MTAPTGTYPPERALAQQTISGSNVGPVLIGEPLAGAAEAALDLIGNQQAAVLAAQTLGFGEVAVGDDLAAFSLDGLDDEGGGLAAGEFLFQGRQIVESNPAAAGHQIAESLAEELIAVHRQRAQRQAVKRVLAENNILPAGGAAGEFQGGLDGFGAAVGEENP